MQLAKVLRPQGVVGALFVFALTLQPLLAGALPVRVEDPLASPGWQHFYNNDYDAAVADFETETQRRPSDPEAYNHLAQAILYRELFRNGALESQLVTGNNPFLRRAKVNISAENKQKFSDSIDKAFSLAQARLDKDPNDAAALYDVSVTHGLRANYLFLVEKSWTDALRDATQSRKYSNKLLEVEPGLVDAYLIQGLHDYVVGSLPFYMRMLGFLAGFHGDREKGLRELQYVAERGVQNKYDARILLAVIYRREKRPADAIPLLQDLAKVFPHNYLLQLEQVQMYSDAGKKQEALAVLNNVEHLRAGGMEGYGTLKAEKVKYIRGNLLFWYGDLQPALADMKDVTANAEELDLNTAVLAWLRLGQIYDLCGKHDRASEAYREVIKTAPDSAAASEAKGYVSAPYKRKLSNS